MSITDDPKALADSIALAVRVIPGIPVFAQELIAVIAREAAHYYTLHRQGVSMAEIELSARARVQATDWRELNWRLHDEAVRGVPRPDEGAL